MSDPDIIGNPEPDEGAGPAKVYPAAGEDDQWVVEAPGARKGERKIFTGPNAAIAALEFAHRSYGSARFFTR